VIDRLAGSPSTPYVGAMRTPGRALATLLAAGVAVIVLGGPALAQDREKLDDFVVLSGEAVVPEGTAWDTVVIFNGDADISGEVGDVVAFNGNVIVVGTVGGDAVSFNGKVLVRSSGVIRGDAVAGRGVTIDQGGTVEGEIRGNPGAFFRRPFPYVIGWILAWLAVSVSTLALGLLLLLLAPRALEAIDAAWRGRRGAAFGLGLALLIGLPILGVLALLTLLGIPFGVGLLLALAFLYALGYVIGSFVAGRLIVRPPRSALVAFLVGWAILRGIALIPFVGGIVGAIATTIGLGATILAMWRARRPAEPLRAQPSGVAP
jgi:hypothetical protein